MVQDNLGSPDPDADNGVPQPEGLAEEIVLDDDVGVAPGVVEQVAGLRDAANAFFSSASQDGLFPIIAYGLDPARPDLLACATSPIALLPTATLILEHATRRSIHAGMHVHADRLASLAESTRILRFHSQRVPVLGQVDRKSAFPVLGQVARRFMAEHWSCRGTAIVDIVEFSLQTPEQQLASRLSLGHAINQSSARLYKLYRKLDYRYGARNRFPVPRFARVSTGDGYYFWHTRNGPYADFSTLGLLLFVCAEMRSLRQLAGSDVRLRAAFSIGEAFMFPYDGLGQPSREYWRMDAVGPVMNTLQRLVSGAAPDQILLADFVAEYQDQQHQSVNPRDVLDVVLDQILREELESTDPFSKDEITIGPNPAGNLKVQDKHGLWHFCLNVTGQVINTTSKGPRKQAIGMAPSEAEILDPHRFATPSAGPRPR
jgi:hypothetical protein